MNPHDPSVPLAQLAPHLPGVLWLLGPDHTFRFVSPGVESLIGTTTLTPETAPWLRAHGAVVGTPAAGDIARASAAETGATLPGPTAPVTSCAHPAMNARGEGWAMTGGEAAVLRALRRRPPSSGCSGRRSSGPLHPDALSSLVGALAASDCWMPLARASGAARHCEPWHRDALVDVWVISWHAGADTGFHDHGNSSGAVAVVAGEIEETHLACFTPLPTRRLRAPHVVTFDDSWVHRMRHRAGAPAVTIHAYSPPLGPMARFAIDPTGFVRRRSVARDEILTSLELPAPGLVYPGPPASAS